MMQSSTPAWPSFLEDPKTLPLNSPAADDESCFDDAHLVNELWPLLESIPEGYREQHERF